MTVFYVGAAIVVLVMHYALIPHVFGLIFQGAFSPESIMGGGLGLTAAQVASIGTSRGIFSHESGLGSSAIAEATAKTNSPVKQGFTSMSGAMLSVVVCTMTGLVLIIASAETALFSSERILEGAQLTSHSFGFCLGNIELGKGIVAIGTTLFAFTTIIGWNYYGEKCVQYLLGNKAIVPFNLIFLSFVAAGPFLRINAVFALADIATGLMAIPNLIGLVALRKEIIKETKRFFTGTENCTNMKRCCK
jgi:AGCS family alanine or glycine:cation symporter